MVRLIGVLVGAGFALVLVISLITGASAFIRDGKPETVESRFHLHPKEVHFASDGPLGRFDRQQVQRGFQVYKEVCAACHGLNQVAIRNLGEIGFSAAEVKALAKTFTVPSIDPNTGEASTRPGIPADEFPSPYPNDIAAAAANNNAIPPDLSLMTKARHNGGAYVYSLLTGYQNAPANLPEENRPGTGLHYNPYFPNLNLAMAAPLSDGQVTYADGTKASVDQMSKDVAAFLVWTAEPKLENRNRTGVAVLVFLLFLAGLAYLSYRNVWSEVKKGH